jgi:hypothetical protein
MEKIERQVAREVSKGPAGSDHEPDIRTACNGGTLAARHPGAFKEGTVSGGQLEDRAAGGEGRVPLWGIVPARRVHRDQSYGLKPGGSALLQQTWHGGTIDQGSQAGGGDDAAFFPPLPHQ